MNRGYESYFRRSQQADYIEHYVNYGLLKAKLNDYYTRRRDLLRALSNEKGQLAMDDFVKLCGSDNDAAFLLPSTANANNTTGVDNRGGVVGINTANSFVTDDALLDHGGNGCEYFLHNDDDDDNYDNNNYDEYEDNGMYYGCSASPSSNYHQTNTTTTTTTTTTINNRRRGKFINGPTAIRHLSKLERLEFDTLLKIELQRSATYYMHTLLPTVRHHIVEKEYTTASQLLLETVAFAITNIITYRQLIIRYDAFCWTFDIVTPVLGRPLLVQHHKWEDGLNTTTTTTTTLAATANVISSSLPVGRVQRIWDEELNTTTTTSNAVSSSLPVGGISSHITTTSSSSNNENEQHSVSRMFALWGINELEISIIVGVQESRTHYMLGEEIPNTGMMERKPIIPTINNNNNNNDTTSTTTTLSNTPPTTTTTTTRGGEGDGTIMTTDDIDALTTQISSFRCLLEKTERVTILQRSRSSSSSSHTTTTTATDVYILRDRLLLFGARIIDYLLIDLQRRGIVSLRGHHFKNEIEIIAKWRENKDFEHFSYNQKGNTGDRRNNIRRSLNEIKEENIFPLFLNLVSCFLFMMNSYIIEPSSAHYAEALGSKDAVAGLMLGATPLFALTSCIAYSYWTNYNYRNPLLFAGILQFLGNFCYANAYAYQSIELCLIGRAMTGLGAPRIINRRYVADATPFKLRTMTSAMFAMAMAVGSACGPGMAILLDMVPEFQFHLPFLETQYFNGMTGPGYFMSLNWFIYTLCIAFFFSEPTRSGLEELKKREAKLDEVDEVELAMMSPADGKVITVSGSGTFDGTFDDILLGRQNSHIMSDFNAVKTKTVGRIHCCSCLQHMTKPVVICMSLIFMKRITLESIVGSTSIITKNRYGWTIKNVGALHLANGIIVIPVSIFSGYLSTLFEDRYMMIWFMSITLLGMTFLFDPTDLVNHDNNTTYNEGQFWAVGPSRYITGSLIAFSGVEACESYIASLISKVVPSALAQGTFNSGLLATLVGTSGQATGDLMIFLMGLISIRNLLNLLIIPGATLVVVSILLVRWNYSRLAV